MANPPARLTRRALIGVVPAAILASGTADAAARFVAYPGVKAVLQSRQTGLFRIAELGVIETLLLCVNGLAVEVHARRNGIYQKKDRTRSQSTREIAPGGLDTAINGTARAAGFYALYNAMAGLSSDAFAVVPVAGDTAARLPFSTDPYVAAWSFAYDARSGAYAFSAGDIRAHWILEGHP